MRRIMPCYHGPVRRVCRGDSWILCIAAFLPSACGRPPPEPAPETRAPPRERPRFQLVVEAKNWPRAFAPFVSRGHGSGDYTMDVRVTPSSLGAVRDLVLGGVVPRGTAVVALHTRPGSALSGSSYTMQKRPDGAWDFFVADADDRIVAGGNLPLCAHCHADAPADSLFVPAPSEGPPSPPPPAAAPN